MRTMPVAYCTAQPATGITGLYNWYITGILLGYHWLVNISYSRDNSSQIIPVDIMDYILYLLIAGDIVDYAS